MSAASLHHCFSCVFSVLIIGAVVSEAGELVVANLLSTGALQVAAYCAKAAADKTCPGALPEDHLLNPAAALFW
jgi:hypothetical protein